MNNSIRIFSLNRYVIITLVILSLSAAVFFSYKDIFDYYFVSGDDLVCAERGQAGVVNILTTSFNTGFYGEISSFYRPITLLVCKLDYSIWGINPFGYYLTNIIIHLLTCISLFFLARMLMGGKQIIAWLSAVIFAVFPIFIFNIAMFALRADTLAGLFIILSMLAFLQYRSAVSHTGSLLFLSIIFYALSFASKETGAILPFIIFTYLLIYIDENSNYRRVLKAVKGVAPFLITTFLLIAWRAFVLKSVIGGYGATKMTPGDIIVLDYFNTLLNPANFEASFYNSKLFFAFPLVPFFASLIFYKRILSGSPGIRCIKIIFMTGLIVSSLCIPAYPFFIEPLVENAYHGQGGEAFMLLLKKIVVMQSPKLHVYRHIAKVFFVNWLYALLFFSIISLIGVIRYENRNYTFPRSDTAKMILFLFIWLLFPLGLYLAGANFAPYYMYVSAIPFSIMISVIFVEGFKSVKGHKQLSLFKGRAVPALAGILILNIFLSSPLLNINSEVKDLFKMKSMFLRALYETVPELPQGTNFIINNIPENFDIAFHTVEEHLNFFYKNNNVNFIGLTWIPPVQGIPSAVDFEIIPGDNSNTKLNLFITYE